MSQLYFYYASMNAGKSTQLLQSAYNYQERGMRVMLLKPAIDSRDSVSEIVSRIGIKSDAITFTTSDDVYSLILRESIACEVDRAWRPAAILIDEAQFMTKDQVKQVAEIVDLENIPVLCYGLRTDFRGELFDGSAALMALADKLIELKGICHCGKKATMVLRVDSSGKVIRDGAQIQVGGEESYVSVCRKHFNRGVVK